MGNKTLLPKTSVSERLGVAEGQHELLKMVRFDYLCINFQTFCVFKTMSVR